MKKILFFFPLNPITKDAGCKTRVLKLLEYFKLRAFQVDFVGLEYWDNWTEDGVQDLKDSGLIHHLFLFPASPATKPNLLTRILKKRSPANRFQKKLKIEGALPNFTTYHIKTLFETLLKQTNYDYLLISYAYWADLISNNKYLGETKTIIDTHDLLTSQVQSQKGISIGKSLEEELRRLSIFDEVWAISTDEQYLFGQFLQNKVSLIPMGFNSPVYGHSQAENKKYDLIYVASDNENNRNSIQWFFNQVYPKLNKGLIICIIGKISNFIDDYPGVIKIPFADDLDAHYRKAKIALCPMLAGTGIKVKVIEALSYSLPVVCTFRGIDGLPNKINNGCLVSDEASIFASNIKFLMEDSELYEKQSLLAKEMFEAAFETTVCHKLLDISFDVSKPYSSS